MLTFLQSILIAGQILLTIVFFYYGCERVLMAIVSHFAKYPQTSHQLNAATFPKVSIQLPIFNEGIVAVRLLESVCQLDYPADKLLVQILDDSTDSTHQLLQTSVEQLRTQGFQIELFHRVIRSGYKAGALADAVLPPDVAFVAIFDSDFMPPKQFLQNVMPYFADEKVGMVQARWGHLNGEYNLLAKAQQVALDAHFMVEQVFRQATDCFLSFNGTAGVWRKATITQAGGWQADTITEDLDLSYRAQLLGWKFVILPTVVVPAELPVEISAFKTQQFRWAKGSTQVFCKLLQPVWRSSAPLYKKIHTVSHLGGYFFQAFALLSLILTLPILLSQALNHQMTQFSWLFLLPMIGTPLTWLVSQWRANDGDLKSFWHGALPLTLLGIGMGLNTTLAIFEGLTGRNPTEFLRTPKYAAVGKQAGLASQNQHWDWKMIAELFISFYALITAWIAFQLHNPSWVVISLSAAGYFFVAMLAFQEAGGIQRLFLNLKKELRTLQSDKW
jgi:cellulose synthase/poly-beta-1,6-N-acetylglucosamine synthase-like glycosyltransferase